jgi:hypothetical protein
LAEAASLPLLDRVRQDFGNQIWQFVGAVLESNLPDSPRSEQIRRIEH